MGWTLFWNALDFRGQRSLVLPLIPGIYDILNQEEGSARFLPISNEGKIYVRSGELAVSF